MKSLLFFSSRTIEHVKPLFQAQTLIQIFLGSVFLALMAQIAIPIPFTSVPITLQTLAVAMLAIALGSKKAPAAVACYLGQATLGLPVLAGGLINPLWMIGPRAGYLVGFMVSSWIIGKLLEKDQSSWVKNIAYFTCGEVSVLTLGTLWLALFVGPVHAISMGLLPFLPGALAKICVAATSLKPIRWCQHWFQN